MTSRAAILLACLAAAALPARAAAQVVLLPRGADWRYLDDGTAPSGWTAPGFDDGAWPVGPAPLGYGDGDEATVVSYGPSASAKFITTRFRRAFDVADPGAFDSMQLRLVRDDGAVVHLNGVEVARSNMPAGPIGNVTPATTAVGGSDEDASFVFDLDPALLVAGTNLLAVEVHQSGGTSSDVSFDLRLTAASGPWVTRGPYLQSGTPTGVVVRWRTSEPTAGRAWWGTAPDALTHVVDDGVTGTEHEAVLTGLAPGTGHFYSVGTPSGPLAEGRVFAFRTPRAVGSREPLRIWAIGDSGTADLNARRVRDAFLALSGGDAPDVWLMLGDNAYDEGTDAQHQDAVFDVYPELLAATPLWPTRGNHETSAPTYHGNFTLPAAGEAGGLPSGTEAYYAFDVGNVHFVCLDSTGSDRSVGGPMWTWLDADLSSTAQDWIVAYWHHPPYTKGSHDSDTEATLIEMRVGFLPLLEAHGVDLVLTGHSHSYERSVLLDGHHGPSTTLLPSMIVDGGDGRPAGDGAYLKGPGGHGGAVHAVAGSSGKTSPMGATPHPVMVVGAEQLGSLVLDVQAARLTATFLTDAGAAGDTFVLEQELPGTWTDLGAALPGTAGDPELAGSGVLMAGGTVTLALTSARPAAPTILFFGAGVLNAPLEGGLLVPDAFTPPGGLFVLGTDAGGAAVLAGAWPAGVPAGFTVHFQHWIVDPLGPFGYAASNAVRAVAP